MQMHVFHLRSTFCLRHFYPEYRPSKTILYLLGICFMRILVLHSEACYQRVTRQAFLEQHYLQKGESLNTSLFTFEKQVFKNAAL